MPSLGLAQSTTYRKCAFEVAAVPNNNKTVRPAQGVAGLQIGPLVPDTTFQYDGSSGTGQESFADLAQGADWICKRIVGKAHLWAIGSTSAVPTSAWGRVLATLGIFVARAEDAAPANPDLDDMEMDPQDLQNLRNPWMFRRTWTFINPRCSDTGNAAVYGPQLFTDNQFAGSIQAGPHIDIKVARRIRKEERLWYAFSVIPADVGLTTVSGTIASQMTIEGQIDLRFLGATRKANNKSTF